MHTGDGATASRYLEQGFQMVTVANELGLITIGGRRTRRCPGRDGPAVQGGAV